MIRLLLSLVMFIDYMLLSLASFLREGKARAMTRRRYMRRIICQISLAISIAASFPISAIDAFKNRNLRVEEMNYLLNYSLIASREACSAYSTFQLFSKISGRCLRKTIV